MCLEGLQGGAGLTSTPRLFGKKKGAWENPNVSCDSGSKCLQLTALTVPVPFIRCLAVPVLSYHGSFFRLITVA